MTTTPAEGKAASEGKASSPDRRVVFSVPEAGSLLGLSRNGSYEAARRGDLPTIRVGRLLLVPKSVFFAKFGEPTSP
jgi:excisionase family DNA binding protein